MSAHRGYARDTFETEKERQREEEGEKGVMMGAHNDVSPFASTATATAAAAATVITGAPSDKTI